MKNRIAGCFYGALTGYGEIEKLSGTSESLQHTPFEKGLRACIRFYQQGKIRGEAYLVDYFGNEYDNGPPDSQLDVLCAMIGIGMAFEREPALDKALELCSFWRIEDPNDSMAYAMLAGILSGSIRKQPLKQTVNWTMGRVFEMKDYEELTELMKLVVALHESRKNLGKTVSFLSDDHQYYKAFGSALVLSLRKPDDLRAAVDYAKIFSKAAVLTAVSAGAMIGAMRGLEEIASKSMTEGEMMKRHLAMAEDLYDIVFNDAILPFDKYVPSLS